MDDGPDPIPTEWDFELTVTVSGQPIELSTQGLRGFVDRSALAEYVRSALRRREAEEREKEEREDRERRELTAEVLEGILAESSGEPPVVSVTDATWKEEGDLEDEEVQYYYCSRLDVEREFSTRYDLEIRVSGTIGGTPFSARLEFGADQDADVGGDKVYFESGDVECIDFTASADGFGSRELAGRFFEEVFRELSECGELAGKCVLAEIRRWASARNRSKTKESV